MTGMKSIALSPHIAKVLALPSQNLSDDLVDEYGSRVKKQLKAGRHQLKEIMTFELDG